MTGGSDVVLSRMVVENGEWKDEKGWGKFLKRRTAREHLV